MGRATEALHYGKHGFKPEDAELYTHIETHDPKIRAKMARDRRKAKK